MKEFNLDAALNGEPVKLRNGNKALICYKLSRYFKFWDGSPINFNICGYILNSNDDITMLNTAWTEDGKWTIDEAESDRDIIGMWEEPKLTSEQVLEKAYQENLPLDAIGKKAFVIAKTKDGDYVMQCGEDNLYFASHKTEWEFYKDPVPKSDTITVTLPKPFIPKRHETYFIISPADTKPEKYFANDLNHPSIQNGNCFRTEEDAQKWLDFMKSMME